VSEQQLPIEQDGPFYGMMANERAQAPPGFLSYILNGYIKDGEVVGRKGFLQMGLVIGAGAHVQCIYQWDLLDGTQHTCAFSNGDLYVYDWAGDTWDFYDLSGEGLTVSSAADITCTTSRGRLVFTDGINKPCMIAGAIGVAVFTTLAAAPISHRCGVYYDKVFFWDIPGAENQFEWSDEADPTSGYAAADQAWEFAQTDAGRILGMAPLNEVNCIIKQDSATMLMGKVDEDFQTLAVREGLSETEGTIAGGSVVILDGDVYLWSANGPRIIKKGQHYVSIHEDTQGGIDYLRDILEDLDKELWGATLGWTDKQAKHVGFLIPFAGETGRLHKSVVYNTKTASWSVFDFDGYTITGVGSVEDTTGNKWVLFGDDNGLVYKYRTGIGFLSDAGTAIEKVFRGRLMGGGSPSLKKRLVELQFKLELETDLEAYVRINVGGTLGHSKRFGKHDETGTKIYRRGCNQSDYELGWEIGCDTKNQQLTLTKVLSFMTAVGLHGNWDG